MLHSTGHNASMSLLPVGQFRDFEGPPELLPRSRGHEREWLDACKGGPAAMSNFDYSGPLTEFVLLGCLAMRVGEPIEWDGPNMKVTNLPEANRFVAPDYREGWSL